jgi:hypothetical protein
MKRIITWSLVAVLAFAAASCTFSDNQRTPAGYVRHCVRLLDRDGLYADSPEWKLKKKEVLSKAKTITTMEEAHSCVEEAGSVAGGKHTFLFAPVKDTASYLEKVPEVSLLDGNILHIVLPGHTGVKVSDSLYIHTVFDWLQEHLDAQGVIVDLRENTGGNMYPMITAVSPLLPDGDVLKFKSRKRTTPIPLDYVTNSYDLSPESIGKFPASTPIAVLTSSHTGSSGEATLLCFRGLDNVKTFGGPSAGYASGNVTHELADGYKFAITRSCDVARTGEVFCDDPIDPDVPTETPLEDAIRWIQEP